MGDLCSVATMPEPPAQLPGYGEFFAAIKEHVHVARLRAVAAANQELLRGYWEIGAEILRRQQQEGWGALGSSTGSPPICGWSSRASRASPRAA